MRVHSVPRELLRFGDISVHGLDLTSLPRAALPPAERRRKSLARCWRTAAERVSVAALFEEPLTVNTIVRIGLGRSLVLVRYGQT